MSVICLMSRLTAGLGVQLLWAPLTNETSITLALNGQLETFAVDNANALEAFKHPYCYGATLPLSAAAIRQAQEDKTAAWYAADCPPESEASPV